VRMLSAILKWNLLDNEAFRSPPVD
jgi:hypothetical protein